MTTATTFSDFYGVDPRHGSNDNFVEFMRQAKERGIKVSIDLVAKHGLLPDN